MSLSLISTYEDVGSLNYPEGKLPGDTKTAGVGQSSFKALDHDSSKLLGQQPKINAFVPETPAVMKEEQSTEEFVGIPAYTSGVSAEPNVPVTPTDDSLIVPVTPVDNISTTSVTPTDDSFANPVYATASEFMGTDVPSNNYIPTERQVPIDQPVAIEQVVEPIAEVETVPKTPEVQSAVDITAVQQPVEEEKQLDQPKKASIEEQTVIAHDPIEIAIEKISAGAQQILSAIEEYENARRNIRTGATPGLEVADESKNFNPEPVKNNIPVISENKSDEKPVFPILGQPDENTSTPKLENPVYNSYGPGSAADISTFFVQK